MMLLEAPLSFSDLVRWARIRSAPTGNQNVEKLSFSVPYRIGDDGMETSARVLAIAYLHSAIELKFSKGAKNAFDVSERSVAVERAPDEGFWAPVVREGWAYYTVSCRIA